MPRKVHRFARVAALSALVAMVAACDSRGNFAPVASGLSIQAPNRAVSTTVTVYYLRISVPSLPSLSGAPNRVPLFVIPLDGNQRPIRGRLPVPIHLALKGDQHAWSLSKTTTRGESDPVLLRFNGKPGGGSVIISTTSGALTNDEVQVWPALHVHEYLVPGRTEAGASIVPGLNHTIWFNERHSVGEWTPRGFRRYALSGDDYGPGAVTLGPDSAIWANPGDTDVSLKHFLRPRIARITAGGTLNFKYASKYRELASPMIAGPGGLMYFATVPPDDASAAIVQTIDSSGQVSVKFVDAGGETQILDMLATPNNRLWLFDDSIGLVACTWSGRCKRGPQSIEAGFYAGYEYGKLMAYDPRTQHVFLDDDPQGYLYELTLDMKLVKTYTYPLDIQAGALAVVDGVVWIATGAYDRNDHPLLAYLSHSGVFTQVAIDVQDPKVYPLIGLTSDSDGHIWYSRGHHIGYLQNANIIPDETSTRER
jgi:hypothetical protein